MNVKKQYPVEFEAWKNMKGRVRRDSHYVGEIGVAPQWEYSFETFLYDMGPRPDDCDCLTRTDKRRDYEPANTRWGTARDRNSGRRRGKTTPVLAR